MGYGRFIGATVPQAVGDKEHRLLSQESQDALSKELSHLEAQYRQQETPELAEKLKNLRIRIEKLQPTPPLERFHYVK